MDLSDLSDLYLADETAWLDRTADLIKLGKYTEIDYANLMEFLESMAALGPAGGGEPIGALDRAHSEVGAPGRQAEPLLAAARSACSNAH